MANQTQLGILRQGVRAWNSWRERNPSAEIDLSGEVLSDIQSTWNQPKYREVDLSGANFRCANLTRCVIKGADLRLADLTSATLRYSNLRRSDLSGASLRGSLLNGVNLTLANLTDADLTNALLWETVLARTNLRRATGLDTLRHGGPSLLDHRTMKRSGDLPDIFLKGIGLPDEVIAVYRRAHGFCDYADSFISHSSHDHDFASRLHGDLQRAGVECWYAPSDIQVGDRIRQTVDDAIGANQRVIVVLSFAAIASGWVESEVEAALELERRRSSKVLIPIHIDHTFLSTRTSWAADLRRLRHVGDFSMWATHESGYRSALRKLLRSLSVA